MESGWLQVNAGSDTWLFCSICGEHSFSVTAKAKDAPQLENGK